MKIKIERFWNQRTKDVIEDINDSLKRMEIEPVHTKLEELFEILKDEKIDSKERVSICFILEQIAQFDPFYIEIINFLIELLKDEKDAHVKEFAVYILGNLIISNPNLTLITRTLPIFVKFCEDSSEYVRTSAEDFKNRLYKVKETKIKEKEIILLLLNELADFINEKLNDMSDRASIILKEALSLDYETAFNTQDQMVQKIHQFSDKNNVAESEIKAFIKKLVNTNPIFEGEFQEKLSQWKDKRAEKEDLIRQVHCIIRIQGKIFSIIEVIRNKGAQEKISIDDLKVQTKGGLKGEWTDDEIIETLEKLVEEEIIPNLFLQQVKDLKDLKYIGTRRKNNTL